VNALNVELLLKLSNPDNVRGGFLRRLFGVILGAAISTFDLDLCYAYVRRLYYSNTDGLIPDFYNRALAHSEDSASNLLQQFSNQASNAKKDTVSGILLPLMKELLPSVNTGSLKVQTCFQLLVETYITKTVGEEPPKPEDWARPAEVYKCHSYGCKNCPELNAFLMDREAKEKTIALSVDDQRHLKMHFGCLRIEKGDREDKVRFTKTLKKWERRHSDWELDGKATQKKLQDLPKELKRALGDKYDMLMALDPIRIDRSPTEQGGIGQASNKAQSPTRPKRTRGEGAEDAAKRISKRARRGGM
jgi:hypothetical protein